jgi:hypothetical protein
MTYTGVEVRLRYFLVTFDVRWRQLVSCTGQLQSLTALFEDFGTWWTREWEGPRQHTVRGKTLRSMPGMKPRIPGRTASRHALKGAIRHKIFDTFLRGQYLVTLPCDMEKLIFRKRITIWHQQNWHKNCLCDEQGLWSQRSRNPIFVHNLYGSCHRGRPGSIPGQPIWDFLRTK